MKSIIYLLIAVFTFSIVVASIPKKVSTIKIITVQAIDDNISEARLDESAAIIKKRFESVNSKSFDLKVIPEKKQIQIKISDEWNISVAAGLLTAKGKLGFYETYNLQEITNLLKDDKLSELLKGPDYGALLGCMNVKEIGKVVEYLKSQNQIDECKFAWGPVNSISETCLYALKPDNAGKPLLSGTDLDKNSVKIVESDGRNDIQFKFIESAVQPWANATKRNIGRAIAIEIDNVVVSAPVVNSQINQGNCMISGNFTKSEAGFLVAILQNGELPADFKIVK